MRGQTPAPHVSGERYERPQERWVCGWAADGNECPLGPDRAGHCRGSGNCQPKVCLEGERRGLYICGRPNEKGGPCQLGPLPDGRCGQPLCQPKRTLRSKRGLFTLWLLTATVAVLIFGLFGPGRQEFMSAGELSAPHASLAFTRMLTNLDTFRTNVGAVADVSCQGCHHNANGLPDRWLGEALTGEHGVFAVSKLLEGRKLTGLDLACQECHREKNFHQPNVAEPHSCVACHHEHVGSGPIRPTSSIECIACHADSDVMKAATERGAEMPDSVFDYHTQDGLRTFHLARPGGGYTRVVSAFAVDHPPFRISQADQHDANPLRFNHQFHLTSGKAPLDGRALVCADCHRPEASGGY